MAAVVYLLCAITSVVCGLLLLAAYRRARARLLLWSCLCFGWLAINNILLVVDRLVVSDVDLSIPRAATALVGLLTLLFGLIYDTGRGANA
jgi:hypothetical protein